MAKCNFEKFEMCFGSFWTCIPCLEKQGSPEFNYEEEKKEHINEVHFDLKVEYDPSFKTLANSDFDEYSKRVQFFVGNDQNLDIMDNICFDLLLKQIESYYIDEHKCTENNVTAIIEPIANEDTFDILKNQPFSETSEINLSYKEKLISENIETDKVTKSVDNIAYHGNETVNNEKQKMKPNK